MSTRLMCIDALKDDVLRVNYWVNYIENHKKIKVFVKKLQSDLFEIKI